VSAVALDPLVLDGILLLNVLLDGRRLHAPPVVEHDALPLFEDDR
jgi:hypothetical protein